MYRVREWITIYEEIERERVGWERKGERTISVPTWCINDRKQELRKCTNQPIWYKMLEYILTSMCYQTTWSKADIILNLPLGLHLSYKFIENNFTPNVPWISDAVNLACHFSHVINVTLIWLSHNEVDNKWNTSYPENMSCFLRKK